MRVDEFPFPNTHPTPNAACTPLKFLHTPTRSGKLLITLYVTLIPSEKDLLANTSMPPPS
jgi:hypothetical protein